MGMDDWEFPVEVAFFSTVRIPTQPLLHCLESRKFPAQVLLECWKELQKCLWLNSTQTHSVNNMESQLKKKKEREKLKTKQQHQQQQQMNPEFTTNLSCKHH